MRRRHADHAHERRARDAHARQLLRRGPAVGDRPLDEVRRRVQIAQEAEAGHDRGEREHVARPGALHEHGSRERVNGPRIHGAQRGRGGRGRKLPVTAVARVEHDLLALVHLEDGLDVGMQSVVPGARLIAQHLGAVDLNALHSNPPLLRLMRLE
jgi:hypothetical protein